MAARKRSTWDKTPWVSGPGYGGNGSATQHFHNVRTGRNRTVKSNYRSNTHTAIYWGGGAADARQARARPRPRVS